jgi:hypothetical protein
LEKTGFMFCRGEFIRPEGKIKRQVVANEFASTGKRYYSAGSLMHHAIVTKKA